ncbi:mitochondrial carrier domain-containing protein [Desarmillaria tabescens]|uniref:Mitochondrial carrier domain-containing protein n=1 Tax=Armillaria tabescens TaxID=1929756 RepID=A0AA39U739_ARMTA|nr:mitochondrial carrier domain-containing protein [Desarmillaria tabescens]KAK0468345.1 mitochondrial carrier domain-containing protein [Desarmillaria tabescens]
MDDSVIQGIAGSAGGIVAMSATYPLIFISTRAAVETRNESKPVVQAVLDILKREGITGLYSGLNSSLLGIAVTNGVYYYFYERSRGAILKSRVGGKGLSTVESIITGLIAGTSSPRARSATTIISNPIWVVQTSQAVRTLNQGSSDASGRPKRPGFIETIRGILAKDGIGAFWRGIGPALVLVMNPVIQYTVFEQLKNILIARRTTKLRLAGAAAVTAVLSDWDFFFLGAISKLIATASTYPYIVIKSRMQAGHSSALGYKSTLDGLLTILREEGIHGLYKGVGSKLTQSVLTAAILFAGQRRIYEITKKALLTANKL